MKTKILSNYFLFFPIFLVFFISFNIIFIHFSNFLFFSSISLLLSSIVYKKFIDKGFSFTNLTSHSEIYLILFVFLIFSIFTTFGYWLYLDNLDIYSDTSAPMGSIETGQYANIANFIYDNNHIPKLKKNYAQSIISAFLNLFKINPAFSLSFFLILIKAYTLVFLYIFLRKYLSSLNSFFVTFIFSILGISLSRSSVMLIDSGFPFISIGYFDTALSIFTLLFYFYLILFERNKFSLIYRLLFYLSWILYAPQNLLIVFAGYLFKFRDYKQDLFFLLLIIFYSFISCGFFLGKETFDVSLIGGLISPGNKLNIHLFFGADALIFKPEIYPSFIFNHVSTSYQWIYNETLSSFTSKFLFILKYFFIIFLFIILFIYQKYYLRTNQSIANFNIEPFIICSIIIFIGFLFIDVNNYKWQLQRFLIPTIYIAILYVFFTVYNLKNIRLVSFVSFIFCAASIGNFYAIFTRILLFVNNESSFGNLKNLISLG